MTLMQLLTIVLLVALVLWAVETFFVVPLRQRRALAAIAAGVRPRSGAVSGLLEEPPLSRLMANVVGGCLLALFAVVILMRQDVDFSLVLVVATFLTGLFWLLDVAIFRRVRRALLAALNRGAEATADAGAVPAAEPAAGAPEAQPALAEYSASFFPVLALVLLLRSFLLEPFTIPSGSMLPTLEVGDYIVVNKYAYGLRLPVLGTEIMPVGKPQRGDVMVFKYPENPRQNYIKRVIGLPGDTVRIADGRVYVNGAELARTPAEFSGENWELYYREKNGAAEHLIRHEEGRESSSPQGEWTVPPASYFMMGDNRDNSRDSRYWGFVPDRFIVGKASYVWMHKEPGLHLPSFSRNGKVQ
jgi:signal peptidase I